MQHNNYIKAVFCSIILLMGSAQVFADKDSDERSSGRFEPVVLEDMNDDEDVVEVTLMASESNVEYVKGVSTKVYTYNNIVPGPTIKAQVGDTLIVHFYNQLPEETTVHWHGLELPANMDGSNLAQLAVQPGSYFRYEFKLLRASTYWYHPHIRGNEQVELGLHGTLIVSDRKERKEYDLPKKETLLVLDDVLLDDNNAVAQPFPLDPLERAVTMVNGREGNQLLVNGKINGQTKIRNGRPHRLRMVNTSNSRFMRVSIPGHALTRIGGDGGLLGKPIISEPIGQVDTPASDDSDIPATMSDPDINKGIFLTPGERADVVFTPKGQKGEILPLEWHDLARGRHSAEYRADGSIKLGDDEMDGKLPPVTMMSFKLKGDNKDDDDEIEDELREITPIDVTGAKTLPVVFGHSQPDTEGNITFFAALKNGKPMPFSKVTPENAAVFYPNETAVIQVTNLTAGIHNFHLHGFMFQHIDTQHIDIDNPDNNVTIAAEYLEEKDTIRIPARPGAMMRSRTVTRLAVKFTDEGREGQIFAAGKNPDATNSGGWLFHCHILEHADRGMASFVQVVAPE